MAEFEVLVFRNKGLPPNWLKAEVNFSSLPDDIQRWLRSQLKWLRRDSSGITRIIRDRPNELNQNTFDYAILIMDERNRHQHIVVSGEALDSEPILAKFLRSLEFVDDRHIFDILTSL